MEPFPQTPPTCDELEYPVAPQPLEADSLVGSVLVLLILTAVQRLIGFLRAVLFCRWLDAEQLGTWDMTFNFLVLAAPLAVLAIPGTFGRYIEKYKQHQQLRVFLRRTISICAILACLFCLGVVLARNQVAALLFGTTEQASLMVLTAGCLLTVIGFNFLVELFTALRKIRLVSLMQLLNSLAFAISGVALLLYWRASVESVLLAYGIACFITIVWAGISLKRIWHTLPHTTTPLPRLAVWDRVAPLAGWILLGSLMINLFGMVDRYMIIHFSNASSDYVLDIVGNYHSSRVVPLLLVSISAMLAGMMLPHLSHDWETHRQELVIARLRLFLKLFGLGLLVAAVFVLAFSPLLFEVAFRGKFAAGESVLPGTLMYSTWFSLFLVVQNYLLCTERARLISLSLACGLVLNILLNLILLPRFGLYGAVLATSAANVLSLVMVCFFNSRLGFHLDDGSKLIVFAPCVICLGLWATSLAVLILLATTMFTNRLLSAEEKQTVLQVFSQYTGRLHLFTPPYRRH